MKPERVNLTKQIFRNGKCQSHTNPNYDYEHNKSYSEKHKYLNYLYVNLTYEHITCAQYLINFASDKN